MFAGHGFFYAPTWGITCYHELRSQPKKHQRYSAKVLREGNYEVLQLMVTTVNQALEYVCFTVSMAQPHLLKLPGSELIGQTIALCSFQLHLGYDGY